MGVVDSNGGMLIWTMVAYFFCALYSTLKSLEILMNPNRRKLETVRHDNKYECCDKPRLQEYEDACWRNVVMCLIGAPIQCAYSMTLVAVLAYDQKELKYINIALVILNTMAGFMQAVQCDRKTLGKMESLKLFRKPLKEGYNAYTYQTTFVSFFQFGNNGAERQASIRRHDEEKEAKLKEIEDNREKIRLIFLEKGIPDTFLPYTPLEGPTDCNRVEYNMFDKNYRTARERDWYFTRWTHTYPMARTKWSITIADACVFVKYGLDRFIAGDECPTAQAALMFNEWIDLMFTQDRIDYVKRNHSEKRFLADMPQWFRDDMKGLGVRDRVRECPIDPMKRRILGQVVDFFTFSCPEEQENGPGLYKDLFGFMWETTIYKDLPVLTKAQEESITKKMENDSARDNIRYDIIYSDDNGFRQSQGKPYEEALYQFFKVKEAFPEGRRVKSLNPRADPIPDYSFMVQTRPDFIGPKLPEYHLPCGPLLRRYFVETTYRQIRDLVFNIQCEQFGQRRMNHRVRRVIRENS
ncbi:hypothetical protein PENTCL1PPCAC_22100 [Pristionchus entomophagus]|uniref:Anoctamin n=1 Tax=Pristionchus entomophagus TaxID=358040 RepID=A0AAV5TZA3_9BILA|nr:hypothetical protein PENTCL1PPCAC_22100 [Pristionchus entomophagus]